MEKLASAFVRNAANTSGKSLDCVYAALVHKLGLRDPFFKGGWGDLGVIDLKRDSVYINTRPSALDSKGSIMQIPWHLKRKGSNNGIAYKLYGAEFRTPCQQDLYHCLPPEGRLTRAQLLTPESPSSCNACVVHLAGTGDHGFIRRLLLAFPLLKKGIATIVLESPYYGNRKPHYQDGCHLANVSDLLVLGRVTMEESMYLLDWLRSEGFPKIGVCGFSMGGVHACLVASLYPHNISCTPLLAPRSASVAFCHGVLSNATSWSSFMCNNDKENQEILQSLKNAMGATPVMDKAQNAIKLLHPDYCDEVFNKCNNTQDRQRKSAEILTNKLRYDYEGNLIFAKEFGNPETAARHNLEVVLETYTDITRYRRPQCPGASIFVGALSDAYVSQRSIADTANYWHQNLENISLPKHSTMSDANNGRIWWVPGGHVSAFLFQQSIFRNAIETSLDMLPRSA